MRKGVVILASGVQYEVLKPSTGRQPRPGDTVTVRYEGRLASGVVFDMADESGKPGSLRIDEIVVPGLKEALLLMREGARWRVVVPPNAGFGSFGNNLLRKRDLIYEIELVSVDSSTAPSTTGIESDQRGKANSTDPKPAP